MTQVVKAKNYIFKKTKPTKLLLILALFTALFLIYFCSGVGMMNSLDSPQLAQVEAVVEEKTLRLDNFSKYLWPDYATNRGHIYSKRDPGFAFLNIPFYLVAKRFLHQVRPILLESRIEEDAELKIALITYSFSSVWTILMLLVYYLVLKKFKIEELLVILSVICLALGTLFWRYSYSFVRQPLVSFLVILAVYVLLENKFKRQSFFLGLIFGAALFVDKTSILLFLPFIIFFFFSEEKISFKFFKHFVKGALIGLVALLLYNFTAFNKPFGLGYLADVYYSEYREIKNYFLANPIKTVPLMLFSNNNYPSPDIISYFEKYPELGRKLSAEWFLKRRFDGVFFITPFIFLIVLFPFYLIKGTEKKRGFFMAVLFTITVWIIFIGSYSCFYAGNSFNTSYLLPVVPLLLLLSTIGTSYLCELFSEKIFLKVLAKMLIITLVVLSLFSGWKNNVLNYAPHITGDFRIDPVFLSSFGQILGNYRLLLRATFPNYPNILIGIIFAVLLLTILALLRFMLFFCQEKIKKKIS